MGDTTEMYTDLEYYCVYHTLNQQHFDEMKWHFESSDDCISIHTQD